MWHDSSTSAYVSIYLYSTAKPGQLKGITLRQHFRSSGITLCSHCGGEHPTDRFLCPFNSVRRPAFHDKQISVPVWCNRNRETTFFSTIHARSSQRILFVEVWPYECIKEPDKCMYVSCLDPALFYQWAFQLLVVCIHTTKVSQEESTPIFFPKQQPGPCKTRTQRVIFENSNLGNSRTRMWQDPIKHRQGQWAPQKLNAGSIVKPQTAGQD